MRKEGAYLSEEVLLEVFHVQVALCKGFDFLDCCSQVICRHLDGSLNTLGFDIVQKLLDLLQVLLSALLERLDVFRVRVLIINGGSLADHRVDSLVDVRQNFWSNVLDLGNDRSSVRLDRTFQSLDTCSMIKRSRRKKEQSVIDMQENYYQEDKSEAFDDGDQKRRVNIEKKRTVEHAHALSLSLSLFARLVSYDVWCLVFVCTREKRKRNV